MMTATDFSIAILVDQTPKEAFDAINNVRGWWSEEIEGRTSQLNDEFRYQYRDVHLCRMKIMEAVPDKKVVWLVMDNYFKFTADKNEWIGTKISFAISRQGYRTEIRFTHMGLTPAYECFDICSKAWTQYIGQSLLNLISSGKGQPNSTETPRTAAEKELPST